MTKITKQTISKRIEKELDKFFNNSEFSELVKTDETTNACVSKHINVLKELNENKESYEKNKKLFEDLTGKSLNEQSNYSWTNVNDLYDQVNYLSIYLINKYKLSFSSNKKIKNIENNNIKKETNDTTNPFAAIFSNTDDSDIGKKINIMTKINNDINTGKIYIYKSKPFYVPILKLIFNIVGFCIAISTFLFAIGIITTTTDNLDFSDIIVAFVVAVVLFCFHYKNLSNYYYKERKNDNLKYCLFLGLSLLFYAIILIMTFFWMFPTQQSNKIIWLIDNPLVYIPYSFMLGFTLINVIIIILSKFIAPVVDKTKIDKLIEEYSNNDYNKEK